jgi:acetyl-CoA synthetase
MDHTSPTRVLKDELINLCAAEIGSIAKPDEILWTSALPKTRSGKIMRRILRKLAVGEVSELGDMSTLADSSIVDELILEIKDRLGTKKM